MGIICFFLGSVQVSFTTVTVSAYVCFFGLLLSCLECNISARALWLRGEGGGGGGGGGGGRARRGKAKPPTRAHARERRIGACARASLEQFISQQ